MDSKIAEFNKDLNKLSCEQIKEIILYAREIGLCDIYNSNVNYIQENMIKVQKNTSPYPNYGLHTRNSRKNFIQFMFMDVAFSRSSRNSQKFDNGAVIVKDDGREEEHLVQSDIFKQSYTHTNGKKIEISDLKVYNLLTDALIEFHYGCKGQTR
ncbi:MAG: hypothetical protein ACR5KV_07275 [Wolbachia sp.]